MERMEDVNKASTTLGMWEWDSLGAQNGGTVKDASIPSMINH